MPRNALKTRTSWEWSRVCATGRIVGTIIHYLVLHSNRGSMVVLLSVHVDLACHIRRDCMWFAIILAAVIIRPFT